MVETSLIILSCGLFVIILALSFILFQALEKNKDLLSDITRMERCECETQPDTICDTSALDAQIRALQSQLSNRPTECGPNTVEDINGICVSNIEEDKLPPLSIVAIALLSAILFIGILFLIRKTVLKRGSSLTPTAQTTASVKQVRFAQPQITHYFTPTNISTTSG